MDIFSSVKDISQKSYNVENVKELNTTQNTSIQKPETLQNDKKDILDTQDKNKLKKRASKINRGIKYSFKSI